MKSNLIKRNNEKLITLEESKQHLRILHNYEDIYISALLDVVTTSISNDLQTDVVSTSYEFNIYEKIGVGENIHFINAPIYKVESVSIYKNNEEINAEDFDFTFSDEYITFTSLPSDYTHIKIIYRKGFESAEDTPTAIKQAALLLLTDLYSYRGTLVIGKSVISLDKTIDRLLQPYRKVTFL
ncbi:head-tail connector protein [Litoribacter alkaliphilus]|uniref:Head-tail connector protein n=1 Tax=Litoribacter ruber TaxID=702568 RepID=A0AAP2CJI9_9BACT|nr:head-tail connector protein [Litoribacter alkaliphilus]MBS9525916.1 head-tail connector protein [Litoribacter alkaliphilus]